MMRSLLKSKAFCLLLFMTATATTKAQFDPGYVIPGYDSRFGPPWTQTRPYPTRVPTYAGPVFRPQVNPASIHHSWAPFPAFHPANPFTFAERFSGPKEDVAIVSEQSWAPSPTYRPAVHANPSTFAGRVRGPKEDVAFVSAIDRRVDREVPSSFTSKKTCSTYKAYVRTATAEDVKVSHRGSFPVAKSISQRDTEVLVLEAIQTTETSYSCKMYTEHSSAFTYTFKMRLSAKYNSRGRVVYKPSLADFAQVSLSGLEISGEEVLLASTDVVARHVKRIREAEELTFTDEGHIVVRTVEETIIFVQSCTSSTTASFRGRRRLQEEKEVLPEEDIMAVVYRADTDTYRVNGVPADFDEGYNQPIDMECPLPENNELLCFMEIARTIKFTGTVEDDMSVIPGPVITSGPKPTGVVADVENKMIGLLEDWNRLDVVGEGDLVFKSAREELTWTPIRVVGGIRSRRLQAATDDAEWTTYEADLSDFSQNGVSGQQVFVAGDTEVLGDLHSFPYRCSVKKVTEEVFVVVLKVVNAYQMTMRREPTAGWVCSDPVPLSHFVGPAPSMLMETNVLKTLTEVKTVSISAERFLVAGIDASIAFRRTQAGVLDEFLKLDSLRSDVAIVGSGSLEGAGFTEGISVRVSEVKLNTFKVLVKGVNTYAFDVSVFGSRPVVSQIVTTQFVDYRMEGVEKQVLEVFETATSFVPQRGYLRVDSPHGSLTFA